MATLRVACLQVGPPDGADPDGADPVGHVAAVLDRVAASAGADLVVLPELWPAGYFGFDRYRDVAMDLGGPVLEELAALAGRLGATVHAGSILEAGEGGRLHNTSVVFGPDGRRLAVYRKVHVFGYESREQELVTGGSDLATFPLTGEWGTVRAGMATCYDLRFPELFRALADDVALFVVPAAWPAARAEHWATLLRARAIENQVYVVGCNATGTDHGVLLAGRSMVVDPGGVVLSEAGQEPTTMDVSIDPEGAAAARATFPALADRRLP